MSISGNQIIKIAREQIGNKDTDHDPPGRYGGNKTNWCSEFVSWVYESAGYPFVPGKRLLTNTERVRKWFRGKSTYISRGQSDWDKFIPTQGDYVYIGRAGDPKRKHSGIVEKVDSGDLHTIEGNNRGRAVDRYIYPNFRTNTTSNDPPETNGIVLGFGLRCGKRIPISNGVASASSSDDGRRPDDAFNNDFDSFWQSRRDQSDDQYLQMAWNRRQTITKISLRFGDHYPKDYRFRFKIGRWKRFSNWKWSTEAAGNDRRTRAHVWFKPEKHVWAVQLYCQAYSADDYFSVVRMIIQQ